MPFMEIYVKDNLDFQIRVYLWKIHENTRNCAILSTSSICNYCAKRKPKGKKAENRKSVCNSLPAKDKAPLSQTSTERIRSKIVSLNSIKNDLLIENKYLKQQVLDLQIELNESSLKVSNELDRDLKTIISNANDKKYTPLYEVVLE